VGSVAIQIAKQVCGLTVIATASRPPSMAYCRELGANAVIDHRQPLAAQVHALGYAGVDYVFSTTGPAGFGEWVAALNPFGKICCIAGGPELASLDVSPLFPLRATLTFEYMFTRSRTGIELEKQGAILDRVSELLDAGVLHSTVKHVLPWEEVAVAHRMIESGHTLGKIVMTL
jgi:NADPH:quinone reductase-like Zn-dependent oxidoreductase